MPGPLQVARSAVGRLSRARFYLLVGILLAAGAPLGLIVLRVVLNQRFPSLAWLVQEIGSDLTTYTYLFCSTSMVFAFVGFRLGRQVDQLKKTAATDSLTGLANRRTLDDRLVNELARSSRYGTPLALLIADLDGLKQLNDRHGHEAGDAALCAIATALSATCRATDLVARLGGDEFVVIAPSTTPNEAMELARRIRLALHEQHVLPLAEGLTVSIGIAGAPGWETIKPNELVAAADRALYEAKSAGRDRVSLSDRSPLHVSTHRGPAEAS